MTTNNIFKETPSFKYQEGLLPTNPQEFENILTNRRSVRNFTSEKVPEEIVMKVLEWGLLAPNSSNLQPWEFYWVKDPEKKRAISIACFDQPASKTAQELIVCVARMDSWKKTRDEMLDHFDKIPNIPSSVKNYYKKIVPLAYSIGFLGLGGLIKKIGLTIVGFRKPVPRGPCSFSDMRVWAVKTTALACQNLMMGFSAHGFDTCPMEGFDAERIKPVIKLQGKAEIVMVIGVGKRDIKGIYGPRVRMKKENYIHIL